MDKLEQENYLNTKYSLDDLKKQRISILTNPTTFTGFDKINQHKDVITKTYYDTPDFFFAERGLAININYIKGHKTCDLVVRWNTNRERIRFLSDIPDTFVKTISVKDSIYSHSKFIAESIEKLVPNGLSVDIPQVVGRITTVFTVRKKRESHTYINIDGLKLTLHFSLAEYFTKLNKNKEKIMMLEVTSNDLRKKEDYDKFTKKIQFNNPTIIKLKSSDMEIGRESLFNQ